MQPLFFVLAAIGTLYIVYNILITLYASIRYNSYFEGFYALSMARALESSLAANLKKIAAGCGLIMLFSTVQSLNFWSLIYTLILSSVCILEIVQPHASADEVELSFQVQQANPQQLPEFVYDIGTMFSLGYYGLVILTIWQHYLVFVS